MGSKLSRRREAPVSSAVAVIDEQKNAAEPAAPQPAADSGMKQEVVRAEDLDVLVEEPPKDECASEVNETGSPAALVPTEDTEAELIAKETQAPAQPEPLVSDANPPEPESFAQPKANATEEAEAQDALTPEDVSEESKADTDPISEPGPTPAKAEEQHKDQEPLADLLLSSPPLIDFVPDVTSSATTVPTDPDESSNISASEQSFTAEPEKFTSDILEKSTGAEAEEGLKTLGSDVNVENVSELLQDFGLKENLLGDIIPRQV
ncbi:fruit protein pKIWI501-like [Fundulus heteroclitus]|uniref:fruit protein pKIWI501-like n=1 Tax=Fundulus heteroclitus TaxID=8078 RepID=UPI00165A6A67|nr:fruit protein pKIWI501-like [Fundulus heteroclitus]